MAAHVVVGRRFRSRTPGLLVPLALLAALIAAAGAFIFYVLWPKWPEAPVAADAPAIPVIVGGALFNVPPAAIRTAVQRQPGAHERLDLVFLWPSLAPPQGREQAAEPIAVGADGIPLAIIRDRLFVTIAASVAALAPLERLRSVYPRYLAEEWTSGPDGLAVRPFRGGTPYEGEDLVYVLDQPERFFARCTRVVRAVPGTCIHERLLDGAAITLRFPRQWLHDWRAVAAGFDRLVAMLHTRAADEGPKIDDK